MKKIKFSILSIVMLILGYQNVSAQITPNVTFTINNYGKGGIGCDITVIVNTCYCDDDGNNNCVPGTEQCDAPISNNSVLVPFMGDLGSDTKTVTTSKVPFGKKAKYMITLIGPTGFSVTITLPSTVNPINLGEICGPGSNYHLFVETVESGFKLGLSSI